MKSFEPKYIQKLVIPHRLITIIRQIGEYKGIQELYRQQAPEMLKNLRHVAMIQSNWQGDAMHAGERLPILGNGVITARVLHH